MVLRRESPLIGSLLIPTWMSFGIAALPRWPVLNLAVPSFGPVPDRPERPCKPCSTKRLLPHTAAVRPGANAEEYHPSNQIYAFHS